MEPRVFQSATIGKAELILTNNTKIQIMTGQEFFVDFFERNTWNRINPHFNTVWELMGYLIEPYASREFPINLKPNPFKNKGGRYRVGKYVHAPDKKKLIIYTEFSVLGADTTKSATCFISIRSNFY